MTSVTSLFDDARIGAGTAAKKAAEALNKPSESRENLSSAQGSLTEEERRFLSNAIAASKMARIRSNESNPLYNPEAYQQVIEDEQMALNDPQGFTQALASSRVGEFARSRGLSDMKGRRRYAGAYEAYSTTPKFMRFYNPDMEEGLDQRNPRGTKYLEFIAKTQGKFFRTGQQQGVNPERVRSVPLADKTFAGEALAMTGLQQRHMVLSESEIEGMRRNQPRDTTRYQGLERFGDRSTRRDFGPASLGVGTAGGGIA